MKLKHDNRSISIPFLKSSMAGLIRRIMIREFFSLGDVRISKESPFRILQQTYLLTLLTLTN
ncbi:hypothetical protein LEP1GSC048_0087 [Leptospira santarosai serovar Shermani str. 1342KT]|nr:hypothetical protein LEP1GSC048_0087 [Leptospira santarosai serovar Shermani str. 1342KT]